MIGMSVPLFASPSALLVLIELSWDFGPLLRGQLSLWRYPSTHLSIKMQTSFVAISLKICDLIFYRLQLLALESGLIKVVFEYCPSFSVSKDLKWIYSWRLSQKQIITVKLDCMPEALSIYLINFLPTHLPQAKDFHRMAPLVQKCLVDTAVWQKCESVSVDLYGAVGQSRYQQMGSAQKICI